MVSTRSRFLMLTGRRYLPVTLPGFQNLHVQSLSDGERAFVEDYAASQPRKVKRVILIHSLVEIDPDTKAVTVLFPYQAEAELIALIDELSHLDGVVSDTVVNVAMKLNKISDNDIRLLLGELAAT
jgi:hypothetical protein